MFFVNDFFNLGYHVSKIPNDLKTEFWNSINHTNWNGDTNHKYKLKFCEDSSSNQYTNLSNKVTQLPMFDVLKMLKSNIVPMKNYIWNGAEDIPWHSDSIRGADLTVFCYFTDVQWDKTLGGTVQFCKLVNGIETNVSDEIMPEDGTIVLFDNINPLYLHKVKKLTKPVNRFVYTFTYKWLY